MLLSEYAGQGKTMILAVNNETVTGCEEKTRCKVRKNSHFAKGEFHSHTVIVTVSRVSNKGEAEICLIKKN